MMGTEVLIMNPSPGSRLQRYAGDVIRFSLNQTGATGNGWRGMLRTNLGRGALLRREIIEARTRGLPRAGASWRDIPMRATSQGWELELPLTEVGYFQAKAYLVDPKGWQHWPAGPDVGVSIHPDHYRSANTLYCAFPRMFGPGRELEVSEQHELRVQPLDQLGYAVIPPSGKLRDLTAALPHIFDTLGCRILQLLPVNPTPTTYARFGRFGSPYAALDLTAIDPALVVFDKRSTGVDQFCELTYAVHRRGGRVLLDIVINHTGWGSPLQENHPEWFLRQPDGTFASPGAWGNTWEDLVELKHENVGLWDELADTFLAWCRRGVDGFRCDAGYKVPVAAWEYIIARVQEEYPETLFLLEGLGGAWEATEALLTEGRMQWAYSELFQNYSGREVATYLDHCLRQNERVGLLVHYSETHDNARLAAKGRAWSLLRNRLCALTSMSGGFAFTCGVEWLATEKIRVHGSTGMRWGQRESLLPELAALNQLLLDHPCFFDGAKLTRLSPEDSPVFALARSSAEGKDAVLVLVNTNLEAPGQITLGPFVPGAEQGDPRAWVDLLGQAAPPASAAAEGRTTLTLPPGAAYCLAPGKQPLGLHGEAYRRARALANWALNAASQLLSVEALGRFEWQDLASEAERDPVWYLSGLNHLGTAGKPITDLSTTLRAVAEPFPSVIEWRLPDRRRITPVPPGHWLLVRDPAPFRAALVHKDGSLTRNVEAVQCGNEHLAVFEPRAAGAEAVLQLERYTDQDRTVTAAIRFLAAEPAPCPTRPQATDLVLLTNGRGGMARLAVDLGRISSKYDCVLGANLHPDLPVDRHIFAKRLRVWVNADGFISPLDFQTVSAFEPGPPAAWHCVANAGDGRTVQIQVRAAMLPGRNATVFQFSRPSAGEALGKQLPSEADVRLTVRVDIEDRNFHWETRRNGGADHHFASHTQPIPAGENRPRAGLSSKAAGERLAGFDFTPAADRRLRVFADAGCYHPQPEWSEQIPHPVEQSRGQTSSGDAYSPGWFELPMGKGTTTTLVVTAEMDEPDSLASAQQVFAEPAPAAADTGLASRLRQAIEAFVVKRGGGKTVIAGYPWFLDWGRDTFISARGMIAAGMLQEVRQIVLTFARFEQAGTLPNTIHGPDASNRDTSDAPLWFGVVCEELAAQAGPGIYDSTVDSGRTVRQVLESIATHYRDGTPNGIRMDPASALIWSPSHFTWMDTNYPAGTPREGYPVEIQALWIRLLRQLSRISGANQAAEWDALAARALQSVESLFWLENLGWYSDVLLARSGQPATEATPRDSLRSNCLFLVSLGLANPDRARRCVAAAQRHLVVPGALRSLAPLPVKVPLSIRSSDGRPLNDPLQPYWGRYEGDEDTRRKPAYHNGTAWTWTFPTFCEALALAWNSSPEALATARAYLSSVAGLLNQGCLGQIPEVMDGDAPHTERGCDAQAWSATEAFRVWQTLHRPT